MSRVGKTLLKGHSLILEGAAHTDDGFLARVSSSGRGKCSCGALSSVLPSRNARKNWHADHKELVRQQQEAGE